MPCTRITLDWARPDTVGGWPAAAGFTTDHADVETLPWQFASGAAMTEFFRAHSPDHAALHRSLGDASAALLSAIENLAAPGGGPVALNAEYRILLAHRRATAAPATGGTVGHQ